MHFTAAPQNFLYKKKLPDRSLTLDSVVCACTDVINSETTGRDVLGKGCVDPSELTFRTKPIKKTKKHFCIA